ncbi:hypothetical protein SAMN04487925_112105 [Bradyrhizobium sp. cf659]|nr:hypothetical protein SAMN04487925_112105 [Bradyrhizobium sp. cf659]
MGWLPCNGSRKRGGGNRHSDKEKFRSDLKSPNSCEMPEWLLKTLQYSGAFQAEYEGSIPFRTFFISCVSVSPDVLASVVPPCRPNDVKVSSGRKPAARMISFEMRST